MICDTTYTEDHHISNELRHVYWFRKTSVKKGDWIKLLTTNGENTTTSNKSQHDYSHFLLGLGPHDLEQGWRRRCPV